MTAIITVPGVLVPAPGMERALLLYGETGFLEKGLKALYLLEDGAGTALSDELDGADGLVETIDNVNAAYAWSAGGGGLQLSGSQIGSFPQFQAADPWSFFVYHRVTNHVGAVSEKIAGITGLRRYGEATVRGTYAFLRGPATLAAPSNNAYYVHRRADGAGAAGPQEDLLPVGINVVNVGRLVVHSFNGNNLLRTTVYDKNANIIATDDMAVTEAQLFTVGGVTDSLLKPMMGGLTGTYAGGVQIFEAFARYDRFVGDFTTAEIAQMAAAGAGLGAARGRAW